MARSKEGQARMEGMAQALRIAKERGIEGLEEDLKMRNIIGLPVGISKAESDEFVRRTKLNVIDTVMTLAAVTLHDEFGFGQKRLNNFFDRFQLKAECMNSDYCTWEDQLEVLRKECGIERSIRWNDKDVKVK
mgnify:CR=1 FL=1